MLIQENDQLKQRLLLIAPEGIEICSQQGRFLDKASSLNRTRRN